MLGRWSMIWAHQVIEDFTGRVFARSSTSWVRFRTAHAAIRHAEETNEYQPRGFTLIKEELNWEA